MDTLQTTDLVRLIDATRDYRAAQGLAGVNDIVARFIMHSERTATSQGDGYAAGVLTGVKTMLPLFNTGVVDPKLIDALEVAWGIIGTVGPHTDNVDAVIAALNAPAIEGEG